MTTKVTTDEMGNTVPIKPVSMYDSTGNAVDVNGVSVVHLFDAEVIAASGVATSAAIDLASFTPSGTFSIQIHITGDGTFKFQVLLSNNANTLGVGDYMLAHDYPLIEENLTKTSGPDSNGKIILPCYPEVAEFMKIRITETGTSDGGTISAWLTIV